MIKSKSSLLFFFLLNCELFAQAPIFVLADAAGGGGADLGYDVVVDAAGNSFVAGSFSGTCDLDPGSGTTNVTAASGSDIFLAEFDVSGALVWGFGFGGGTSDMAVGVSCDASGGVYITGQFMGTVDFDPGVGVANLTGDISGDCFVAKYSSTGVYQWAFRIGGAAQDFGHDVFCDASGNVYVTGMIGTAVDLDPSAGIATTAFGGGVDAFIGKYSSMGTYIWGFGIGGAGSEFSSMISSDNLGNIYWIGYYNATVDFDPSSTVANKTSTGSNDVYVAKYSSSGAYQWAVTFGGTSTDFGYAVKVDNSGAIDVCGRFTGTANFNPLGVAYSLTSSGIDVFVAQYNNSGIMNWAYVIGGTGIDIGYGITVDATNDVFVSGEFASTCDFDPTAGIYNMTSIGMQDIFVLKLTSTGLFGWVFQIGSSGNDNAYYGLVLDSNCNLHIAGAFSAIADFDPSAAISNRISNGAQDFFLAIYQVCTVSPLPIELTQWQCETFNDGIKLTWSTASEMNNDYFTIERSIDGITWESIAVVDGAGTSSFAHYYSLIDQNPLSGNNYYRLFQTDFNGSRSQYWYSECVALITEMRMLVYSMSGQLILSEISTDYQKSMNEATLASGVYIVELISGNKSVVKKFVKTTY